MPGVNVTAIWSLPLAVVFSPLGVILAHVARSETRRTGERGSAMATAALIVGYPVCGLWLVFWLSLVLAIAPTL